MANAKYFLFASKNVIDQIDLDVQWYDILEASDNNEIEIYPYKWDGINEAEILQKVEKHGSYMYISKNIYNLLTK